MSLPLFVFIALAVVSNAQECAAPYADKSLPFGPNIAQYAVKGLPDVNYSLPDSWAGLIKIPGTEDDALYFWLFEAEEQAQRKQLIIWLNGGPGCTSLAGLTGENGPLAFYGNATVPASNPYSWTKLSNVLYIDQPVGTGFSTGSTQATSNAQVTEQFYGWLTAFYAQFPRLAAMDTYIVGESFAGVNIPYFAQAIMENSRTLPINLRAISLGDPFFGNPAAMIDVPMVRYLNEQNQILRIPDDVMSVFNTTSAACGFDYVLGNLTYPPHGIIVVPGDPEGESYEKAKRQASPSSSSSPSSASCSALYYPTTPAEVSDSIMGPCDGPCATGTTAYDYLGAIYPCFDIFDITSTCATNPNPAPVANYLNQPTVRAAIHAPDKMITDCNSTVQEALAVDEATPPVYAIIPALLARNVSVHVYSGDYDLILPHLGTELVIQNMTWCAHSPLIHNPPPPKPGNLPQAKPPSLSPTRNGLQGFQCVPSRPFYADGILAGNWGYEVRSPLLANAA
ncbi:hypothetical protein MMC26_002694 [Xylographa opegraphella]|nr:hypothetical protein [Xylographa opegraphella]